MEISERFYLTYKQGGYGWVVVAPGGMKVLCTDRVNRREVRIRKRIHKRWAREFLNKMRREKII
jgi:hypothetical protein